jgi:hypothetical protein
MTKDASGAGYVAMEAKCRPMSVLMSLGDNNLNNTVLSFASSNSEYDS